MIPIGTVIHITVALAFLYRALLLVTGQPLGAALQCGLLLVGVVYALDAAHWCWTVRPDAFQQFQEALWRGEMLPRENVQATVTKEPAP